MDRTYYIPKNAMKITDKATGAEAYIYDGMNGKPSALVFAPKSKKPVWRYYFTKPEAREKRVASFFAGQREHKERVEKRRAERARPHKLEVGHVLYSSWGYDQTNVNFYQVTRVIGKNSVELREIEANNTAHDGWATGKCIPAIDCFKGQPMTKRVDGATNTIRISSCEYARLWDGRPLRWSSYA